jgi:hypothetical protein
MTIRLIAELPPARKSTAMATNRTQRTATTCDKYTHGMHACIAVSIVSSTSFRTSQITHYIDLIL